jgi:tetratricopeptide (TPR) repeat protein
VAIEFSYRFRQANPNAHVFWVYGGNIARFYQGYKSIAQALALPSWDDPDVSILELVSAWFREAASKFLLVVDNADNITHWWPGKYRSASALDDPSSNLANFLPESKEHGRTLFTTRDNRIAGRLQKQGRPIALQPMTAEEAQQLFHSKAAAAAAVSGFEESDVCDLVHELDYLPLAVSQAASFIEENSITVAQYLAAIRSDDAEEFLHEELNDSRRDEDSINSVFRTWKLSFDSITQQKPAAAELLSLLAMLDRQSVPKWLLKGNEVTTSLGTLQAFHLITTRAGSQSFQLHRLVQRFVQLALKRAGTAQKWREAALVCVSRSYPTVIGVAEWPVCDALAPHVRIVTGYKYDTTAARLELAHLLCWAADFDIERGMYVQALRRAKRSLSMFQELVPEEDQRRAAATWLYGRLQYYEAESDEDLNRAADTLKEALRISANPSLSYAESAFELAHFYHDQSNKEACLHMSRASFECWKAMEGTGSVRTLDNMHDYALELALLGHSDEAVAKWQEIVALCPASDLSENTKTVCTYRSLASIAEFQGDASFAEVLYQKLITLCTAIYNPQHRHVFDYRLSHAEQVLRQGRLDEAMVLSRDILSSCENKSEWQIRACCLQIMAECCRLDRDLDGEQTHRLECLELHASKLGRAHKQTIDALEAYGRCRLSRAQFDSAAEDFAEILRWRNVRLGRTHADTVRTIECQGICSMRQGRDNDAEADFLDALNRQTEADPRLLNNLCASLWNQGKWEELEIRIRQVLKLDADQPAGAHWDLIIALEQQGKMEEALALRASELRLEDANIRLATSRREPEEPPARCDPMFGRMIHPRTWSA